jgi:DNA polymerase-3 subunit epsilon
MGMYQGKIVVLDVEKANNNHGSICQIGLIVVEKGVRVAEFETLINPKDEFNYIHTGIHGIKPEDVINSPSMADIKDQLAAYFDNAVICSYGTSDKFAIGSYFDTKEMPWVDITRVVRNALPVFKKGGFQLLKVAQYIGLMVNPNNHHNALSDAEIAFDILHFCLVEKRMLLWTFYNVTNKNLI